MSVEDIISAINEIDPNASGPDYSLPAPVLKKMQTRISFAVNVDVELFFPDWSSSRLLQKTTDFSCV